MQRRFGEGEAFNLARRKIIAPGGLLAVMGGGLLYDGVLGVKTYTVVKGKYSFHVSLYDAETGGLLCYTQANRLGQLRTGATTGVATKYLTKADSATVGIIGTGNQALTQLEAIKKQRDIKRVKAFSRTPERREAFARAAADALGIDVTAVDTPKPPSATPTSSCASPPPWSPSCKAGGSPAAPRSSPPARRPGAPARWTMTP